MPNPLRNLPSVSQLLESPTLKKMVDGLNHNVVADSVRSFLDEVRTQVTSATEEVAIPTVQELADKIATWLEKEETPYLRKVINATGIILHTGFGRAPLSESSLAAVTHIACGYASVEVDLETGERGQRIKAVERLLCELTGAEAATIVNNNAAATMITLATLATGKEVIVSRGQLIEIGGSYRLPDVMECSGATLRAVGTTNKTHLHDYENAIGEQTGALLKVHPSNYAVVGFTKSLSTKDLVKLARRHGNLPMIDDVGSGALVDFNEYGLHDEPIVSQSISDGADVVLFSGDKLIGGPQCGIIVGRRKYVDRILKNPLMRAMRVGKMTLAALAATLREYRNKETAEQNIPLLRMLSMPIENLKLRAEKIVGQIGHLANISECQAVEESSMIGGGSLPTEKIATWCVSILPNGSVDALAEQLRKGTPSIVGRVNKDRLLLDMRTVNPAEDLSLVAAFETLAG